MNVNSNYVDYYNWYIRLGIPGPLYGIRLGIPGPLYGISYTV